MTERNGWRWCDGSGRFAAVAVTLVLAAALGLVAAPAAAQYLFGGPPQQRGGGFFNNFPFFEPFQRRPPPRAPQPEQPRVDYSRAPAPEPRDEPAARNVLVLGDAMADWLAYGLEQAFAETPELGVIREVKPLSGLIRYQAKGEPADWATAAKGILAQHSPEVIVVMLGLSDRVTIRETAEKAGDDSDAPPADDDAEAEQPQVMAPEKPARGTGGSAKFRDERWIELYGKKIDAMIAVLKGKGVPVVWVGLPAILGTRSTSDMLLLDSLYREAAARADITYVDVWDGFVDEAGRFTRQGPDFEGQTRRLRTPDGVFFTKAGARKLAHYAEREIQRLLAARSGPIALPTGPDTPDTPAAPEGPAARPLGGPIVPLVAASVSPDQLLGAPGSRPLAVDALASRTLTKGEPLTPPAGRADDVVWPRREAALEKARGEAPVVAVTPAAQPERAARPRPERTAPPQQQQQQAAQQGRRIYDTRPPGYAQRPPPGQMQRPMPPFFGGPTNWLSDLFRR
jgi:hypothetical protein